MWIVKTMFSLLILHSLPSVISTTVVDVEDGRDGTLRGQGLRSRNLKMDMMSTPTMGSKSQTSRPTTAPNLITKSPDSRTKRTSSASPKGKKGTVNPTTKAISLAIRSEFNKGGSATELLTKNMVPRASKFHTGGPDSNSPNSKGPKGPKGSKGKKGTNKGPKGSKGSKGPKGKKGTGPKTGTRSPFGDTSSPARVPKSPTAKSPISSPTASSAPKMKRVAKSPISSPTASLAPKMAMGMAARTGNSAHIRDSGLRDAMMKGSKALGFSATGEGKTLKGLNIFERVVSPKMM